jgi:ParB-like chromosome segregation protein Spo0J
MKAHPAAEIFPMMTGDAWSSFVADIKTNGVQHPVIVHDGMILDGRNRYAAAQEAGVECPTKEYPGGDPVAYIMSANVQRRHLTTAQRAAFAAELASMQLGSNQHSKKEGTSNDVPITIDEAASMLAVGRASVDRAKAVMRTDPEMHEAAKAGKEKELKAQRKGKEPKAKEPAMKWQSIAQETGAARLGNLNSDYLRKLKADIDEIAPGAIESKNEPAVREACEFIAKKTGGKSLDERYEEHRQEVATLKETAAQKFDRLINTEKRLLQEMFQTQLREEAKRMLPEMDAEYKRMRDEYAVKNRRLAISIKGISPQITEDDYRLLLNVLHPDRAPEDRKERFAKAFDIVRKLDEYISSVKALKS